MNESARENQPNQGQEGQGMPAGSAGEPSSVSPTAELAGASNASSARSSVTSNGEQVWSGDDAPTIISKPVQGGSGSPNPEVITIRGRRLAHFELEKPIGVGGMAAVVRARDTQLDRVVALKILPPGSASDPDQVKRFEREARAAARLDHENIARVYYCGEDQGLRFIAFEYVEGENLRDMIARRGRIPVREATEYVLQVARGLAHAADRAVVHRDIKPSNVIVTASGLVKLVDMGLARTLEPTGHELTQSGATLGTFDYISPEQALDPRLADTRSDIYSLGCTFYHMLTGKPPTPEGTAARKLHFHQHERPVDPRYYNPEIPRELVLVLGRMLAKDPQKRYQHPRELIEDLQLILQQWSSQKSRHSDRSPLYRLSPSRGRGRLVLAAAIVITCGIGVASWIEAHRQPGLGNQFSIPQLPFAPEEPTAPSQTVLPSASREDQPSEIGQRILSVETAEELRKALESTERKGKTLLVRLKPGQYELASLWPQLGLALSEGDIILEPQDSGKVSLQFDLQASAVPAGSWFAFRLERGLLTLRRVSLSLRLPSIENPVGLFQLLSNSELLLDNCEIVVESANPTSRASVFTITGGEGYPQVRLLRTVLASPVPLFQIEYRGSVYLENCALKTGPDAIVVGLSASPSGNGRPGAERHGEEPTAAKPSVTFKYCTWWLESGPALLLRPDAALDWKLERCVLGFVAGEQPANLVELRQKTDNPQTRLSVQAQMCAFYQIRPGVVTDPEGDNPRPLPENWDSDKDFGLTVKRDLMVILKTQPWRDDLKQNLEQKRWAEAYRLRDNLVELRESTQPDQFLGVQELLSEKILPPTVQSDLISPSSKPIVRELIVDGKGGKPNTFDNLSSALSSAAAEAEGSLAIVLRVNGPVPIRSVLDVVGGREVTIRADTGYSPELSFHPERIPESDRVASLFRVLDGKLILEGVNLRIQPLPLVPTRCQSALLLTGSGSCTLRKCRVTLGGGDAERTVALAVITDPTGTRPSSDKPLSTEAVPQLLLEDCFLRGKGMGIYVQESRPLKFDAQNVLAVLQGPLLRVDIQRTETAQGSGEISCTLERVSVCSGQCVVDIHAMQQNAQPVLVRWQATSSLFVTLSDMEPLIRIEGPQNDQELRRNWMTWSGQPDKPNFYKLAGSALVWKSLEAQAMMSRLPAERVAWSNFWGTDSAEVRFLRDFPWSGFNPNEADLTEVEPSNFRVESTSPLWKELNEVGADVSRLSGSRYAPSNP